MKQTFKLGMGSLSVLLILFACGDSELTPTTATPPASQPTSTSGAGVELVESLSEELNRLRDTLAERRAAREAENAQSGAPSEPGESTDGSAEGSEQDLPQAPTSALEPAICTDLPAGDADRDGIKDACEAMLAERHAPVYVYSKKETHYPWKVEDYLSQSALFFYDAGCRPDIDEVVQPTPEIAQLLTQRREPACGHAGVVLSRRTRSKGKERTFYLQNLEDEARVGSSSPESWGTYVHVYPNTLRGVTLQYWTFYAYDEDSNHGGDWEGFHVVLDAQLRPNRLTLLNDEQLKYVPWAEVEQAEAGRPRIYVAPESHTHQLSKSGIRSEGCGGIGGFFSCGIDLEKPETFTAYDSAAQLVQLGERKTPLPEAEFIQYSGLWGNATGGLFRNAGDWGPAYAAAGLRDNGFLGAWADQMVEELADFEEAYVQDISP